MSYWRKNYRLAAAVLLPCTAYNLYFLFLLPDVKVSYLIYLDFLIATGMGLWFLKDFLRYRDRQRKKREMLRLETMIAGEFRDSEDADITAHDVGITERRFQEQFDMNCELQDYMAKWCHEVKIPLAASLLMTEQVADISLKNELKEQLERMNLQLKSALLGAKIQSSLFDFRIRETGLGKCVKASIHNNQFFLIRKHFQIRIRPEEETCGEVSVYSDAAWLTYVLDQLISNAVKYAGEEPCLAISWAKQGEYVTLCVEDNGEGIQKSDIHRIFEKGYTGSNYHNGQYKSTGMGLYMVSVILERLGHTIVVESEYRKGTKFTVTFSDNREYRNVTKM